MLSSVSASPNLAGLDSLAGLAFSLKDIEPSEIVFTELPIAEAPTDKYRVVWTKDAQAIWDRMAADERPPGHEKVPTDPRDDATVPGTGTGTGTATEGDTGAATGGDSGVATDGDAGAATGETGTVAPAAPPEDAPRLPGVCAS